VDGRPRHSEPHRRADGRWSRSDETRAVVHGPDRPGRVSELALVLRSVGIEHVVLRGPDGHRLVVHPRDAVRAEKELRHYVEENAAGLILPRHNRLELGRAGGKPQIVGLRFPDLRIPRGSKIAKAYVQFTCRIEGKGPADFRVHVPTGGDISPFGTARHSLSRLRARMQPEKTWALTGGKAGPSIDPAPSSV